MDLQHAEPSRVAQEIETSLGIDCSDAIQCSGKTGLGVKDILESIVNKVFFGR
jgi:GTP-binding protein LepA